MCSIFKSMCEGITGWVHVHMSACTCIHCCMHTCFCMNGCVNVHICVCAWTGACRHRHIHIHVRTREYAWMCLRVCMDRGACMCVRPSWNYKKFLKILFLLKFPLFFSFWIQNDKELCLKYDIKVATFDFKNTKEILKNTKENLNHHCFQYFWLKSNF